MKWRKRCYRRGAGYGKIIFETRAEARTEIRRLKDKRDARLAIYPCPGTRHFHIGSVEMKPRSPYHRHTRHLNDEVDGPQIDLAPVDGDAFRGDLDPAPDELHII
jgi:hypothetical protein